MASMVPQVEVRRSLSHGEPAPKTFGPMGFIALLSAPRPSGRFPAKNGLETVHNARCKRWQNGLNEIFSGKFRDECLNAE